MNENKSVVELSFHTLWARHEVWREVSTVELHTFNNLKGCLKALSLFNGDNTLFSYLLHRLSDDSTDLAIRVRGDSSNLSDLLFALG